MMDKILFMLHKRKWHQIQGLMFSFRKYVQVNLPDDSERFSSTPGQRCEDCCAVFRESIFLMYVGFTREGEGSNYPPLG